MTVQSESGMGVSIQLVGARPAPAERAGDEVAFRGAAVVSGRAFDFVLRSVPGGVEDFIHFDVRPAEARVRYRIDISSVSGLRLVDDVLEFLDSGGAPRLRVRRPHLIDTDGRRYTAALAVHGCAVDTSALAPWGRPVTSPGASSCELEVSWSDAVRYPAALDPAWVDGGTMVYPRNGHAAALMANGKVLVPGGWLAIGATSYTNVVEIFDPSTKTWAATKPMNHARGEFNAVTLPSGPAAGKVLAIAGDDAMAPTAEIYDPALATWTDTSAMKSHRDEAAATLLSGGKVLVAGGCTSYNTVTCLSLGNSAEVFDPATGVWTATTNSMSDPREYFTLSPLADGRAVAAGGCKQMTSGFTCFNSSTTADIYDPTTNSWTPTASLPIPIQFHVGVTLSNGKVLVAGGIGNGTIHRKSMLFDPTAGTWTVTGDLSADHDVAAGVALPNGRALIAGSWGTQFDINQVTGAVDVFDATTSTWSPGAAMKTPHGDHTATTLTDGRVLVAGGFGQGPSFSLTESNVGEIYDDSVGGAGGSGGTSAGGSGGTGGSAGGAGGSGGTGGSVGGAGGSVGTGGSAGGAGGSSGGTGGTPGTGAAAGSGASGGAVGGTGGSAGGVGGAAATGGATGSGGAMGGAAGNGGASTGGAGASGGSSAGSSGDDSGCGCSTPGGRTLGGWLTIALALAHARRRKRPRTV